MSSESSEADTMSDEDEELTKVKSRKVRRVSSDYEPDESELKSYRRAARKQARFDSSMFFDSEASSDDEWNPGYRERVKREPVYSSDSDSLEFEDVDMIKDSTIPPKVMMVYNAWGQFITFSQFTSTKLELEDKPDNIFHKPWSPYEADIRSCQIYLKLLSEKCKYGVRKLDIHYKALCTYLQIGLEEKSVDQQIKSCKLDVSKIPKRLVKKMDTYSTSIHSKVWDEFSRFCYKVDRSDPFLAGPNLVSEFLILLFRSKDVYKPEDDRILRPYIDFYSENTENICKQLSFYSKYCYSHGHLRLVESEILAKLKSICDALDQRELPEDAGDVNFIPNYWFIKYQSDNHRKVFWRHGLVRKMLDDITTGHLTVTQVAWQLAVSQDMILSTIGKNKPDEEIIFTLKQYISLELGTEEQYWEESSTKGLLQDVRERNLSADEAAFKIGVHLEKVLKKVGVIKTEEQIANEKQPKRKDKNVRVGVKLTPLQAQIKEMEKNEDGLSPYEKMRLTNMRERQMMLDMLNMNEDKEALNELVPNQNLKSRPKDYGTREKSTRIKRQAEININKNRLKLSGGSRKKKQSSDWVGMWTPKNKEGVVYTPQEISAVIPVPTLDMEYTDLIESDRNVHRTGRVLQRIQSEVLELEESISNEHVSMGEIKKTGEFKASKSEVVSIDFWGDIMCVGDTNGCVGVTMAGQVLSIKPHHLSVSRSLFSGGSNDLNVMSGSLDGSLKQFDLHKEHVKTLVHWKNKEVRWVEEETRDNYLVNLHSEKILRFDCREGGKGTLLFDILPVVEKHVASRRKYSPSSGTNLSMCPYNTNLLSVISGNEICVYDLRSPKSPLYILNNKGGESAQGWSGAMWNKSGSYLLGCQIYGPSSKLSQCVVIWDGKDPKDDSLINSWPADKNTFLGASFSRYYGASWSYWQEDIYISTAKMNHKASKYSTYSDFSIVAVDAGSNSVVSEMSIDMSPNAFCIASHPTRPLLALANSSMPGMLTTFKYNA